jgi:hypothetical protein
MQASLAHGNKRVYPSKHENFCRFHIRKGETMAFSQNFVRPQSAAELRLHDRLTLGLVGIGVIFASLGLGEAVYRFAFRDFDGATDRLPIEMLFGLAFAWMTTKLARKIYLNRMETSARINFIRDRSYKIRHAAESIKPLPYPGNHQAIRVIREEVDRIEFALTGGTPR